MSYRRVGTAVLLALLLASPTFFASSGDGRPAAGSKVAPSLLLGSAPLERVIVAATGSPSTLSGQLHVAYTLGASGGYLAFGVANRSSLMALASLPQVERVYPDVQLSYNDSRLDLSGGGLIQTDMFRIRQITGAAQVNSQLGINGSGVRVAVVDTGTDFGNVELSGAVARDSKGLPLALDPDGSGLVLTNTTLTKLVNSTGVYLNMYSGGRGVKVSVYLGAAGYPFVVQSLVWPFRDFKIGTNSSNYIVSQSGRYHFGIIFEQTPAGNALFPALLVDSKIAGAYDTVYVDFKTAPVLSEVFISNSMTFTGTPDYSFWGAAPHHLGDGTEPLTADLSGNGGLPTISAGLLGARVLDVFGVIGSGKSEFNYDLGAVNGTLLAPIDPYGGYFGVMYDFEGHGTQTAASVASRGVRTYNVYGNGTRYQLQGVAPGSTVMAVKALYIGDVLYGWMWASGFDYSATTSQWVYSGNHRAQIVSNSWGISNWPLLVSGMGYDVISVLEDALSVPGSFSSGYPGTLMVQAMGNGGPGYGTITLPASASFALSVGASTSWHSAQQFSSTGTTYYGGASSYHDDVISWSDRGPSPIGDPKPDVVDVGAFGFTPAAVMTARQNGSDAWSYFGGTSEATPLTAGAAALVAQAVSRRGGSFVPSSIKDILMSTAADTGNDPFVQGAGRVDSLASVSYALGGTSLRNALFSVSTNSSYYNELGSLGGAEAALSSVIGQTVSLPSSPQPSESWFAGYVGAGNSSTTTLSLANPTTRTIGVTANTSVYQVVGEAKFSNVSVPGSSRYVNLTRAIGAIPKGTDLMVMREDFPFAAWDNTTISPYYANALTRLRLQVYNWADLNHDGVPEQGELAIVNTNYAWANSEEVRISNPGAKFAATPLVGVYQSPGVVSYWFGKTLIPPARIHFTVYVYFLKKVPWPWMTLGSGSLTIPPDAKASLGASLSVPSGASPGIYEGFITLSGNNSQRTEVPVSVSVPIVPAQKGVPYVYGAGNTTAGVLYDNGATYGATDFSWRYESGNWRYYRVLVTDPSVNEGTAKVQWTSASTSVNLFVLDSKGAIVASSVPPGLYKSITRSFISGIPILASASNDYLGVSPFNNASFAGGFAPSANNGPNSSVVQFPVTGPGLYTLVVHTTVYSGLSPSEPVSGEVELSTILPDTVPLTVSLQQPAGPVKGVVSLPLSVTGLDVSSVSYTVDGLSPTGLASNASSLVIDTTKLPDGPHTISVSAADAVGHASTRTLQLEVVNTAPRIFVGYPTKNSDVFGAVNVTVSVSGTDVTGASLTVGGQTFNVLHRSSVVWNSTSVPDGPQSLVVTATNAAGNSTATVAFTTVNQQHRAQQQSFGLVESLLFYSLGIIVVLSVVVALLALRRTKRF